ncbi:MAG TPA: hypothetical protein VL614_03375 [Acetobacteraceae bacterium]|jgi:hypothetical protein|nr:hypothetical protein [Acetobacteraceae bacterium]
MNQKEARANGLPFGAANAQKVLKRIREHVLWANVPLDDWRQFNEALLILEPLAEKYQALWDERCAEVEERNRRRREEWLARQERAP